MYAFAAPRGRVAAFLRWHPEWPVAVVVVAAWAVLLGRLARSETGMTAHHANDGGTSLLAAVVAWTLMAAAMMLPVAAPAIGYVVHNSLRYRRARVTVLYVLTFVAIWVVYGIVATAAYRLLAGLTGVDQALAAAGVIGVAAAWQLTPFKRRALNLCMRTVPLPPLGLKADVACVEFAALHARRCLCSCWPLMLLMAVAGHAGLPAFGLMVVLTVQVVLEELTEDGGSYLLPSSAALLFAAGLTAGWSLSRL